MDNVVLHVISYCGVREVLLHSLVHPSLFTKQTWKLLCKKLLFSSWSDYKHICKDPRRRFVEIAYRKGLQPRGLSLYSNKYLILFTIFSRNLQKLREMVKKFPRGASSLYYKLTTKKKNVFFQREIRTIANELGMPSHYCSDVVAEAEERRNFLVDSWDVATRLLINGDEVSLKILEDLFFLRESLGGRRPDSCTLSFPELVLADRDNVSEWLDAYSFSKDDNMIRELLKSCQANSALKTVLQNLYTVNNISLAKEIEKEHDYYLWFDDKLEYLTNYYLFTGDDKGFYQSLLELLKGKQPLIRDTNIIFEVELYEVRELLKREDIENPLT
nr:hypothetical protein Cbor_338 [Cedratvirus borely]